MKDELEKLGFGFVPLDRKIAANGMSAVRYPKGIQAGDIIPKLAQWVIIPPSENSSPGYKVSWC